MTSLPAAAIDLPYEEHRLANGLRVVISEDHVTPAVAVCLWYDVGSRNEVAGKTGFAHLFEHIMFQGSRNVPGNGHFEILQSLGATLNGTTSFDRTNYFETVPSNHLATALWLEADRMGTLSDALDQANLDNQRDVVKNERRQRYDNVPYGTLWEKIVATVIPSGHPYDHLPIGSMEDLSRASLQDCIDFWRTYYGPNNAVLAIVGDVEPTEALELVETYFGSIPSISAPPPPRDGAIGPIEAEVRVEIREAVPAQRWVGVWRVPTEGSAEYEALELAAAILSTGEASRLPARLVRKEQIATGAGAGIQGLIGGVSLAQVQVMLRSGATLADAERVVTEEISSLASEGPTPEEMDRAKAQIEREYLSHLEPLENRADAFCEMATKFNDPGRLNELLDRALAPTAEDVRSAVATYLRPENRAVFTYLVDEESDVDATVVGVDS